MISLFRNPFNRENKNEVSSTLKVFFLFIKRYSNNSNIALFLLFVGAIIAGILELAGLIVLYYLIRVLINYNSLSDSHFIKNIFNSLNIYDLETVIVYLGIAITVIFILKNLYVILYYYSQSLLLKKWKIKISSDLMTSYLYSPYEKLIKYNSATIIRNINSLVPQVIQGFMLSGLNFFANIIVAIIIMSALFYKYFTLTVIIGVLFLIGTITQNFLLKKKSIQLGKEKNKLQTVQNKHIFQGIYSIKETKVYQKENYFLDNFKESHYNTAINDTKSSLLNRAPTHITEIILIISLVAICSYVILENVDSPEISVATLGLLAAISFRVAPLMNRTVAAAQNLNKNLPSVQKLFKEFEELSLSDINIQSDESKFEFKDSIAFKDLNYKYPNSEKIVLDNLSFKINKGEKLAIVGASGTGKSTLVSLLLGLLTPSTGSILVDNEDLQNIIKKWRNNLGYVPQDVYISDDTITNNVAFGLKAEYINQNKVEQALQQVNLKELYNEHQNDNNFTLGENGKRISGGQKQRIGIARAIYRASDILIMDEPTSSLDAETEHKIMDIISKNLSSRTIIFITHRLSSVVDFDKILFLSNGKIEDFGTFEQLIKRNEEFYKMASFSKLV